MIVIFIAIITLLFFLAFGLDMILGYRGIPHLERVDPASRETWPKVSIVVAARNEERQVGQALQSILDLDYPALEIIVVNDRSTDRTGEVLRSLSDNRLTVVDINELPDGWLGKNHALHVGAARADGEILLFTDADVMFAPGILKRAVVMLLERNIDHMTAVPLIISPSIPLAVFVTAFGVFFSLYARPWKARDPKSKAHIGVGAFNLVRADAYGRAGGHEPIAMRPDDDIMLGKLLKKTGARQEFVHANGMIRVEWYSSLGELIEGLMKNGFAGVNYSVGLLVAATVVQLTLNVWPFLALFFADGVGRTLNLCICLIILLIAARMAHLGQSPLWHALGYPLATVLFLYILWKSAFRALRDGGIRWRDTLYPLAELRANRI